MVGDMSRVTLNFDLPKFLLCISSQGQDSRLILTPKIKHVHLLVLIWERLQTMMTTTPDTTVQPLGDILPKTKAIVGLMTSELEIETLFI